MVTGKTAGAPEELPILPLRNSVLFPASVVPINVGRPRSVRLVEELAGSEGALVGVVAQQNTETVEPTFADLHAVGTVARVVRVIRNGASSYSVVLNGLGRFRIEAPLGLEPFMRARIVRATEDAPVDEATVELAERLRERTRQVLALMPNLPKETPGILDNVREPGPLADLIASNFPEEQASVALRQQVLDAFEVRPRVELVLAMVERQLEILRVKDAISTEVAGELSRSQRDYVLRQQIRTIREELGESSDDDELEQLRDRVARAELPPEAERVARKQLARLGGMQPQSAEFQVTRTYVEWLADLPWSRTTPDRFDVREVRRCLEEDHHGLERVKRRIVEYSAIRQLRRDKKGPILLFVGPPGVGKTSLGRSIARAMGRRYARIALGGVRDEAEIRGHRRTYVGALPGRIIQALKKVGTRNPVLVLDEVDKMGADVRGDPAAALLEVLDPEQNDTFVDHYIDLPFDLSEVTFLATANYRGNIPEALRDRMEIIEVPGYTRSEKLEIAAKFLAPKQLREHALTPNALEFSRPGYETIIDYYTREAGVRGLEREIAAICRDATVRIADGKRVEGVVVDAAHVEEVLGIHRQEPEVAERELQPGVATGLALTSAGGDLLLVETSRMPGKGELIVTGSLRSVMKESAATALSFVRSHAERLGLEPEWLRRIDLHLHVPRAGIARDAASAGVAMFVSVVSLLLGAPARADVAMTGELTLRGAILPVSGVKDKILAAHRAGIKEVVLPARNARDLDEVPDEVKRELRVHLISRLDELLPLVLAPPREPSAAAEEDSDPSASTRAHL
ncbi:MAG: endopeptidase La [Sorangiineae bacterium]|nr:endopeptidase La [Polyangiaceae bacterium]MEB2324512.1 endopeptidase La [Sorangiineae bacterium]